MVKLKIPKRETPTQKVKRAMLKMLKNKKMMTNLAQMTNIMWKLNDKERIALMNYHNLIEDNARWDMLTRCFDEMIQVMKPKEFQALQQKIRKKYGFWKVKKKLSHKHKE